MRLSQAITVARRIRLYLHRCLPALVINRNALVASDGVIIRFSVNTCRLRAAGAIRLRWCAAAQSAAWYRIVLMTMYDRTRISREVVDDVRRQFPRTTFKAIIPRSVRLSEAPSFGEPILSYAPESSGAMAYAAFGEEFLETEPR